jgi:ATP-dependent helicase/nuclease subunit B
MSLQFIIGSAGAGKSHYAYSHILAEAGRHPEKLYYVIVPEQFTMQTQKTLVELSPTKGILNIDVLSFERLAYRVTEETGGDNRKLLDDVGKSMVLRKLSQRYRRELPYLGSQMNKPGCLDEVKSLISEFMQYDIQEEELDDIISRAGEKELLKLKLRDVGVLYRAFREYLLGHYMTGEEMLDVLVQKLSQSKKLKDSEVLLDGFTGFTPIQVSVLQKLLTVCSKVTVTVTMDAKASPFSLGKPHQLFYMSRKMIHVLSGLTKGLEEPVLLLKHSQSRFAKAPALDFLEQHIFRYHKASYEKEQEEIQVFCAASPLAEMEETARRIARLVRTRGMKYGEMAVITGDLERYGNLARQVFGEAGIPYFIDEKHSVLMNPFVEYLRSAIEMIVQNFSYESVFRYLRCGMSGLTGEETDALENYVLALGIRGYERYKESWVRIYRGQQPEELQNLNESRKHFVEEVAVLAEGFSGKRHTVEEYCRILYQFIVDSEIQQKLKKQELGFKAMGDKAMEKEYAQIYGIVMGLLDRMVEILGGETVNRREFQQLLETGLAQAKVALIPPSMDQVQVGDMERTRLKNIRALFFVGVNEGNIAKNAGDGGILTELDREFVGEQGIELAPGPKERMNMQRFYLYLNLTKPEELLCLSYSLTGSSGESVSPAYLISNVLGLYPGLLVKRIEEQEDVLDKLELPVTSLDSFLTGLSDAAAGHPTPLFAELYSWYLKSPIYCEIVKRLVEAAFFAKPRDVISKSVAKVLYGEISPCSATRLEKFCACAFAHFLQYGLGLSERVEYEFQAMDMGNVVHYALERFAEIVGKTGGWAQLTEESRNRLIDSCLDEVAADYGNTILKSSARNRYMIERVRRILRRTVWALQEQLKNGEFMPEGFEVSFGGGRIDRVDIMEEDNKVYVRVIDYKTGGTTFDLVSLYYGLQLQLLIYLDGALEVEGRKYPDKEIIPAGTFYYNIKDPMISQRMDADVETVSAALLKELKMNGLVQADTDVIRHMDRTCQSLPVSINKDGTLGKRSSVATREQFEMLNLYVKDKISQIQDAILAGEAEVAPYELGQKNACTYCPYSSVCGFDRKLPGYEFRHLQKLTEEELWKAFTEEEK